SIESAEVATSGLPPEARTRANDGIERTYCNPSTYLRTASRYSGERGSGIGRRQLPGAIRQRSIFHPRWPATCARRASGCPMTGQLVLSDAPHALGVDAPQRDRVQRLAPEALHHLVVQPVVLAIEAALKLRS